MITGSVKSIQFLSTAIRVIIKIERRRSAS